MKGKYIQGDCMDYLHRYKDDYFDLAIIDPPYGIGEDGGKRRPGRVKQKNGKTLQVKMNDYNFISDDWDSEQPNQDYFDELFRVSKHQIIWGCNYIQFDQKSKSSGRIV